MTPTWRENVRDVAMVIAIVSGGGAWLFGLGRKWVESAEFQRYQEQQDLRDRFRGDEVRAMEKQISDMAVKLGETSVRTETIQDSVKRIEINTNRRIR